MRAIMAALLLVAGFGSLPALGSSASISSFRSGLSFSRIRPLSGKQQALLLEGLRQWTGFAEIQSDREGFVLLGNRALTVGGSATARALLSAVMDGPDSYTVEGYPGSADVAFARIQGNLDYVNARTVPVLTRHSWSIAIDFHDYDELRGQTEAIRSFDPALNLLHELAHGVLHLRDSSSDADPLGDCEKYINRIRRELGVPERESYRSANTLAVTPYGTGQRILGELTFVRSQEPGKRAKRFRLTFDVGNVSGASLKGRSPARGFF